MDVTNLEVVIKLECSVRFPVPAEALKLDTQHTRQALNTHTLDRISLKLVETLQSG